MFDFSNCYGCRLFFWDLRLISPAFFKHNNWFVATVHYKVYILFFIIWNYSWALYRTNCLESGYFLEDGYQLFWGTLTRWIFSPKKHIKNLTEIWHQFLHKNDGQNRCHWNYFQIPRALSELAANWSGLTKDSCNCPWPNQPFWLNWLGQLAAW